MLGIWMSVIAQENRSRSSHARKSSADANPRASWPSERTSPTSASRMESSSSTMEIKCPSAMLLVGLQIFSKSQYASAQTDELLPKIQSAHSRQADVENDASGA